MSEKITNVVGLAEARNKADYLASSQFVCEVQESGTDKFESMVKKSMDSVNLQSHLMGYEVFAQACRALHKKIGGSWSVDGKNSYLLSCMDAAVKFASQYGISYNSSFEQIQMLLISELADKVSSLACYETIYSNQDGTIARWDIRSMDFSTFLASSPTKKAIVLNINQPNRMAQLGLRVRILSMVLNDASLGMAMLRRF